MGRFLPILVATLVAAVLPSAEAEAADLARDARKAFRSKDPEMRVAALGALAIEAGLDRKQRNRAAAAVEKALKKETHPGVRIAALEFLYRLGTDRAFDRLLVGIVDPRKKVRAWVRALVRDKPDKRLHDAVLRAMREDASWKFRARMIDLLIEARWSTTRRAIVDALGDEHAAVRARAAEALERLTGKAYGTDRDLWLKHFRKEAEAVQREEGRTYAAKSGEGRGEERSDHRPRPDALQHSDSRQARRIRRGHVEQHAQEVEVFALRGAA